MDRRVRGKRERDGGGFKRWRMTENKDKQATYLNIEIKKDVRVRRTEKTNVKED